VYSDNRAYGKLVYLLQDSSFPEIEELLQFKLARPIRTVYECLRERGALEALNDPWIAVATGSKPRTHLTVRTHFPLWH